MKKRKNSERNYPDYLTREDVDQLNALFNAGKTREAANLWLKIRDERGGWKPEYEVSPQERPK